MDRRRTLLAGGKKPPMYVYQPGYTSWQNCDSAAATGSSCYAKFSTNYVRVYNSWEESYYAYNINFNEARYKGYEKLIIVGETSNTSSQNIYWETTAGKDSTRIQLTRSKAEYVIDISKSTGNRRIQMQPYGDIQFTIYDIHFE